MLTVCWILFGILTYYAGIEYKEPNPYTVKDVIWELKNSYFTSVILALLIAGYSQNSGYKKRLEIQHDLYTDSMYKFEYLFKPFIGSEIYHYMPFYNRECLNDTLEYIEQCELKSLEFSAIEFKADLEGILEQLDKIETERLNNNILGMHKENLGYSIQHCKDLLRRKLKECETIGQVKDIVDEVSYSLLAIIADIRRPWRWDVDNNNRILTILAKYEENDIHGHFYYSMHLYGHKF